MAHWVNDGASFTATDSTAYSYSGSRGGDLNHPLMFDNSYTWGITSDTVLTNQTKVLQDFNTDNTLNSVLSQVWTGTAWQNTTKVLYFYDGTGKLVNKIYQAWGGSSWVNYTNDAYTYTADNRLYSDQYQYWNSTTSTFNPSSQKVYYYNTAGKVTQEIDQVYNTTISAFDYSAKFSYTYSSSNQLLTTTYSTWNGTTWDNSTMYTYSYDTSANMTAKLYQTYDGTTASWVNVTLDSYSGFTSGMPGTDIYQTWDATGTGSWVNVTEWTNTYNGFSQLTTQTGESWNVAGFWEYAAGDMRNNYYYSSYVAGVNNVTAVNGDANIFPVPAQSNLNIDLKWNNAQSATITMVDMQGRVISTSVTPAVAHYTTTLSVDGLSAGMYILKIDGANGSIVKQIVVAH